MCVCVCVMQSGSECVGDDIIGSLLHNVSELWVRKTD